jgi:hypothetical protein
MKPGEIKLVPVSSARMEQLRKRDDYKSIPGTVPIAGTQTTDNVVRQTAVEGVCDMFDLSDTEDRRKYAELTARLRVGIDSDKLWEEHIKGDQGKLYVYVSYLRVVNVNQTPLNTINLGD